MSTLSQAVRESEGYTHDIAKRLVVQIDSCRAVTNLGELSI